MSTSVFLTRPEGKNQALAAMLADAGIPVCVAPALQVFPNVDPDRPQPLPNNYQLVVFVSGLAAQLYLDGLGVSNPDFSWPSNTYAATVGEASAQPLYEAGCIPASLIVHPKLEAAQQDSEALWPLLVPILPSVRHALLVRGQTGREWLGARLEQFGIQVTRYAMYRREPAVWNDVQRQTAQRALRHDPPAVFLLTSGQSVDSIVHTVRELNLLEPFARSRFVVVHGRIAQHLCERLAQAGQPPPSVVKICSPTDAAIYRALLECAGPDARS